MNVTPRVLKMIEEFTIKTALNPKDPAQEKKEKRRNRLFKVGKPWPAIHLARD